MKTPITALRNKFTILFVLASLSSYAQNNVGRNVEVDDDKMGFVASYDHNPQKSRTLLMVALMKQRNNADLQKIFYEY